MTSRRNFLKAAAALPPLLSFPSAWGAPDPSRQALIIGNSAYRESPLVNPANDAKAVAGLFSQAGFAVESRLNTSRTDMLTAIEQFGAVVKRPETKLVVFYYAGHGAQLDWRNYLLPIDAVVRNQDDMKASCVDIGVLLGQFSAAKDKTFIVILDACRNNPFGRSYRPEQKGLSQFDAPVGSLLAYATSPGNVAADGEGANGLYTEHVLREFSKRNTRIEDALKRVRLNVRLASNGEQIPWETTSLEDDIFLFGDGQKKLSEAELEKQLEADIKEWGRIKSSRQIEDWVGYLRTFPNGRFAEIAQIRLARLLAEREKARSVAAGEAQQKREEQRLKEEQKRLEQERVERERLERAEAQRLSAERKKLEEAQQQEQRRREAEQLALERKRQQEEVRLESERKRLEEAERRKEEEQRRLNERERLERERQLAMERKRLEEQQRQEQLRLAEEQRIRERKAQEEQVLLERERQRLVEAERAAEERRQQEAKRVMAEQRRIEQEKQALSVQQKPATAVMPDIAPVNNAKLALDIRAGVPVPVLIPPSANPYSAGRYPLRRQFVVGDEAIFQMSDLITGADQRLETVRVTRVDMDEDRVELNDGMLVFDLMGNAIKNGPIEFPTPLQWTPAEFQVGMKWTATFRRTQNGITSDAFYDFRVVRRETIQVPAGTFDTFRIEGTGWNKTLGNKLEATQWVVPNLNFPVRRDQLIRTTRGFGQTDKRELVSLRQHILG